MNMNYDVLGMPKIFARILPNLPEKKLRPPKKKLFMFFWARFLLIFLGILWFSDIFPRFPRIFTNQNFW